MKITSSLYIIFISFILLIAGKNKKTSDIIGNTNCDTIIVPDITKEIDYGAVINSYNYIPLETSEESLIGSVSKMNFINDHFYILDERITKSLFVFDSLGKYILKINNVGKGPGEYVLPNDFSIDTVNKRIIIACINNHKLLFYNMEGEYLSEKKLPFYFWNFALTGNGYYTFYLGNRENKKKTRNNILIMDSNWNIVNEYLPYSDIAPFLSEPLKPQKEHTYFIDYPDYFLYKIINGNLTKSYYIDFKDRSLSIDNLPNELFRNESKKEILRGPTLMKYLQNKDVAWLISNPIETPAHLFINFTYKSYRYSLIYSKVSKNHVTFKNLISDKNPIYIPNHPFCNYKDKLACINYANEPSMFLEYYKQKGNTKAYDAIKNEYEFIKPTDNPIIAICGLKDF